MALVGNGRWYGLPKRKSLTAEQPLNRGVRVPNLGARMARYPYRRETSGVGTLEQPVKPGKRNGRENDAGKVLLLLVAGLSNPLRIALVSVP